MQATADEALPSGQRPPDPKAAARRALILEGPVHRGVFLVALPSVATMLLQTTNGFLDRFFVGSLGPSALAAITVANSIMFALMSAVTAISVGTTALVARAVGEGQIHDAEQATQQSVALGVVIAVAVGLPMYFLRYPLLSVLGLERDAMDLAAHYLAVTILGLPTLFLMFILNGAFRGLGDTVRPFWVSLFANIVHAIFNYLLIFGNLGFPKMGLPGGALALVISQTVAIALYVYFLRHSSLKHMRRSLHLERSWAQRIGRIGLPASAQQLIRVGSMLTFQGFLTRIGAGSAAVAALGVGLVSESMAFMPGFGYSIAASAFVGQNLGARQVKRAQIGAWSATWQAITVMSVMGVVFYVLAEPFAHLFIRVGEHSTPQQQAQVDETIRLTVAYLRIAAFAEPFLGLGMVLTGALQGAGETISPTILTAITMILLRLPLAYFLAVTLDLGTTGAWWSMTLSTIVNGLLVVWIFRQGHWMRRKI